MSNPSGYRFTNANDDDDDNGRSSSSDVINGIPTATTSTTTNRSTGNVVTTTQTDTTGSTMTATTTNNNNNNDTNTADTEFTTTNTTAIVVAVSSSSTTTPFPEIPHSTPPPPAQLFTLPDGRIIDGKNTLQSFDTGDRNVVVTSRPITTTTPNEVEKERDVGGGIVNNSGPLPSVPSSSPMLPDGRIIDGKNTLQSFVAVAPTFPKMMKGSEANTTNEQPVPATNTATTNSNTTTSSSNTTANAIAIAVTEEPVPSLTIPRTTAGNHHHHHHTPGLRNQRTPPTMVHAEAVAVVDAEISESQIEQLLTYPPPVTHTPKSRRIYWMACIVILGCIAIGMATYCGTGNCSTNSSSFSMPQPSMSPTTLYDQSLSIACTFLNLVNLSECQNRTLFSRNLLGDTIPSEIGLLTQMTSLELDIVALTGSVPSTVGALTKLEHLLLNENQLTGSIPSTFGNLTELVELRLNQNQLTGIIPSVLGDLKQLTLLRLHTNQLRGTIPSILGSLTELTSLSLRDNFLNGIVPSSLGGLTLLTGLWLFNNTNLTGTIPSTLCSVSKLNIRIDCANIECTCCFDYSGNTSCPVTAPALSSPTNVTTPITASPIKAPTLSPTSVMTPITASPSQAPTRLRIENELLVACTFLNISSLSVCQAMTTFDGRVMGNTIPTELGLLTQLTYLSLIDNQLSGTIPSTLGNLSPLMVLYLSTNQLTGSIPSTLGNLMNLTNLSLLDNQLTGIIPSTLGNLVQLTYLDVGNNSLLSGTIPSTLCLITGIEIYLDCTNITCTCCPDSTNSASCL